LIRLIELALAARVILLHARSCFAFGDDSPRRDEMLREPFATRTVTEQVVTNATSTRRRVNDSVVTREDRDMIDARTVVAEEEQITWTNGANLRRDLFA
jgi:hypothetical protein